MKQLTRYVVNFNPSGLDKLRKSEVRVSARSLTFYEESPEAADMFLRRYVRNFCRVVFNAGDFSIHAPTEGPESRFGLLSDRDQQPSKPGMCGA